MRSSPIPRRAAALAAAALVLAPAAAGGERRAAAPVGGPGGAIALQRGWQLRLDPAARGLRMGWQHAATGAGWHAARVPGVFDARPLPALFGGTVGWYRLRFRAPRRPPAAGWAIRFEQARRNAAVWLNGVYLGRHDDAYTPFELAARGLRPGAPNTLVVRVSNRKGSEPREGWWNWGGLTRPVTLVPRGPLGLVDPGVVPQVSCGAPLRCTAGVAVLGTIVNRTAAAVRPTLSISLAPPGGGAPLHLTRTLAAMDAGASAPLHLTVALPGAPALWSPEHPQLYRARLELRDGRAPSERAAFPVGMRQVSVRDGELLLNGRPIMLHGASIEEDIPGHGSALTAADASAIVAELKALHANATRSQYPLNGLLLDRLDRAGIMVWSQAPIYHRDELLLTAAQRAAALDTLRGTLVATRSHPSVIVESVANELSPTPDAVAPTHDYLAAAAALARSLNPGAPAALDLLSYPGFPAQRQYASFDALGINNYFGWYAGKPDHSTARLRDLTPYLRAAHARYPEQALVMTEFGAEANVGGPASVKQTYAFQTHYIARTLAAVGALPFMSGAIYWTLREFAVKPHWDGGAHRHDVPRTSIHHKGLITYGGRPKPAFGLVAGIFARAPLYRTPAVPGAAPSDGGGGGPLGPGASLVVLGIGGLFAAAAALALRSARRSRRGVARAERWLPLADD